MAIKEWHTSDGKVIKMDIPPAELQSVPEPPVATRGRITEVYKTSLEQTIDELLAKGYIEEEIIAVLLRYLP